MNNTISLKDIEDAYKEILKKMDDTKSTFCYLIYNKQIYRITK